MDGPPLMIMALGLTNRDRKCAMLLRLPCTAWQFWMVVMASTERQQELPSEGVVCLMSSCFLRLKKSVCGKKETGMNRNELGRLWEGNIGTRWDSASYKWSYIMAGQPTPPNVSPSEIRPY